MESVLCVSLENRREISRFPFISWPGKESPVCKQKSGGAGCEEAALRTSWTVSAMSGPYGAFFFDSCEKPFMICGPLP